MSKTGLILSAEKTVSEKYQACSLDIFPDYIISEYSVIKNIRRLKSGTAPGIDGITPDHLKYGVKTILPNILSHLFTVCVRYGVIPRSFTEEILIPILKKPNSDPTVPSNYRPVTVSVTMSKLMEYYMYILDSCSSHEFSACQFGFIPHRGTNMATTLAHNLCNYANSAGSALFLCNLDA